MYVFFFFSIQKFRGILFCVHYVRSKTLMKSTLRFLESPIHGETIKSVDYLSWLVCILLIQTKQIHTRRLKFVINVIYRVIKLLHMLKFCDFLNPIYLICNIKRGLTQYLSQYVFGYVCNKQGYSIL